MSQLSQESTTEKTRGFTPFTRSSHTRPNTIQEPVTEAIKEIRKDDAAKSRRVNLPISRTNQEQPRSLPSRGRGNPVTPQLVANEPELSPVKPVVNSDSETTTWTPLILQKGFNANSLAFTTTTFRNDVNTRRVYFSLKEIDMASAE